MTNIRGAMLCPVCHEELKMMDRQGVEIDYCPKCRGVWLDRGELDKIIDRSASFGGQAPAQYADRERFETGRREDRRGYDRDFDEDDDRRGKRRRGGFLGDLFDFD